MRKRPGNAGGAGAAAEETRRRDRAERLLRDFLERLRGFTVLDPACGSGNFLYLALQALKDWSTGCSWKARRWVWTASSPPSARPT